MQLPAKRSKKIKDLTKKGDNTQIGVMLLFGKHHVVGSPQFIARIKITSQFRFGWGTYIKSSMQRIGTIDVWYVRNNKKHIEVTSLERAINLIIGSLILQRKYW